MIISLWVFLLFMACYWSSNIFLVNFCGILINHLTFVIKKPVSEQHVDSTWFWNTLDNFCFSFMVLLLFYSFVLYMFLYSVQWIITIESFYMFDRSWRIFLPIWATLVGRHDNEWVIYFSFSVMWSMKINYLFLWQTILSIYVTESGYFE